jgi:hypothetical protein
MLLVDSLLILLNKTFSFHLAQDAVRNDKIAQLLERRQDYDERENNRAVNEFRALHQQPSAQST